MIRRLDRDPVAHLQRDLAIAIALLAVVTVAFVLSDVLAVGFALALAPFVVAISGTAAATAAIGMAAAVIAAIAGAGFDSGELIALLSVVIPGSALAIPVAVSRARDLKYMERFGMLNDIAELGVRSPNLGEALEEVCDTLVPDLADFCVIDVIAEGELERVAVRVDREDEGATEARIAARAPTLPAGMDWDAEELRPAYVRAVRPSDLDELAEGPDDRKFLEDDLGLGSYIKVPLISRQRRLGLLTLGLGWSGRRYLPSDEQFSRVLSGRVALALDNAGLFSELRHVESRMETVMEVLDEAVLIQDRDHRVVFANPAAAKLLGREDAGDLIGPGTELATGCRFYDSSGMPADFSKPLVEGALSGAAPEPRTIRIAYSSGAPEAWVRLKSRAVATDGDPTLVVTVLEDLSDLKREELAQTLLGRTGELSTLSNDRDRILERLASLAVPELADQCEVMLEDPEGETRRATAGQARPGSVMVTEMRSGSDRIGRITFVNSAERLAFDDFDQSLANRIAARASAVLENARLARARAEIADSLQSGLLPAALPEVPGWSMDALFEPAGDQNRIGGDFYEAFEVADGWMVAIGDVTGRGAHAASVSAHVRYAIRTAGNFSSDPGVTMEAVNRALLARSDGAMCTVALLVLGAGGATARVAVAGHPPPLLVRSGSVAALGGEGPILGVLSGASWQLETVELEDGDRIVLHTDGITEAASGQERFGEDRLHELLLSAAGNGSGLLRTLETAVRDFCGGALSDDIAAIEMAKSG